MNTNRIDSMIIAKDSARLILDFLYSVPGSNEYCSLRKRIDEIPEDVKKILFSSEFEYIGRCFNVITGHPKVLVKYENGAFHVKKKGLKTTMLQYSNISEMLANVAYCYSSSDNEMIKRLRRIAK